MADDGDRQGGEQGQQRRGGWLAAGLWAGLVLLLAGLAWLVLAACGIGWPGGWSGAGGPILAFCPEPAAPDPRIAALQREQDRQRTLEIDLQRLQVAIATIGKVRRPMRRVRFSRSHATGSVRTNAPPTLRSISPKDCQSRPNMCRPAVQEPIQLLIARR